MLFDGMPRKKLIRTPDYPYHITTRANHKFWFALDMPAVWNISLNAFKTSLKRHPCFIHAYVLMQNHYHLLITTPQANIDSFMYEFNKSFSNQLRKQSGLCNRMFGARYSWSLVDKESYMHNVYRYIHQNPLRANITSDVSSYPYSTWYYEYHKQELPFDIEKIIDEDQTIINNWLNTPIKTIKNESIRRGLSYSIFKPGKNRQKRQKLIFKTINTKPFYE